MSFLQREHDKIYTFLCANPEHPQYGEYYAAQQALAWAMDPNCAASPYAYLSGDRAHNPVNVEFSELPQEA